MTGTYRYLTQEEQGGGFGQSTVVVRSQTPTTQTWGFQFPKDGSNVRVEYMSYRGGAVYDARTDFEKGSGGVYDTHCDWDVDPVVLPAAPHVGASWANDAQCAYVDRGDSSTAHLVEHASIQDRQSRRIDGTDFVGWLVHIEGRRTYAGADPGDQTYTTDVLLTDLGLILESTQTTAVHAFGGQFPPTVRTMRLNGLP